MAKPYYGDVEVTDEHMIRLNQIVCKILREPDDTPGGAVFAVAFRLSSFGVPDAVIESVLTDVVRQVANMFG